MSHEHLVFIPGEKLEGVIEEFAPDNGNPVEVDGLFGYFYPKEIMDKYPDGFGQQHDSLPNITIFSPTGELPRKPVTFMDWPQTGIASKLRELGEFVLATTKEPEEGFDAVVYMPKIENGYPPPYSINGISGDYKFSPPKDGEVFYCREGWPVVSKKGNVIRLHIYTASVDALSEVLDIAEREDKIDPQKAASEFIIRGYKDKVDNLKAQATQLAQQIEDRRRAFQESVKTREQTVFELSGLSKHLDTLNPLELVQSQLDKIRAFPKVSEVFLLGSNIVAHCPDMTFTNPDTGDEYLLGDMDISIPLDRQLYVRFNNRTRRVEGYWNEDHHPHVQGNGKACFGDFELAIEEARAMSDWATAVDVCILFLESVNPSDPAGATYDRWPEA
jgi:hypothetical protein